MSNSVEYLKSIHFNTLTLHEKCEIKTRGRPVPMLNITQNGKSRQKEYTRSFTAEIYIKHEWICGCEVRNALFCFPCLLFGDRNDPANVAWVEKGIKDLKRLKKKSHKHEISQKHLKNVLNFATLGSENLQTCFSQTYKDSIERHNAQVQKNRDTLSKVINCLKFCAFHELASREQDESEGPQDQGLFMELLKYTSEIDSLVKSHLESKLLFNGTSRALKNQLLQCMLEVIRENTLDEIKSSEYVSLMIDETGDYAEMFQLGISLRYCNAEGYPVERLWGFFSPDGHSADCIADFVTSELGNILSDKNKLIGQTYDGADVMSEAIERVQAKVRQMYPNAYLILSFTFQLKLIMQRATSQITEARVFFSNLLAIPAFFSGSSHRKSVLASCVAKHKFSGGQTELDFKSRTVNVVYENQNALKECFRILSETKTSSAATVNGATALLAYLQNPEFCFWLNFFRLIMPHMDILDNRLHSRHLDVSNVQTYFSNFAVEINKIRDMIGSIKVETNNEPETEVDPRTQKRLAAAIQVCDVIMSQSDMSVELKNHLSISTLLQETNFKKFSAIFPEKMLSECVELFPVFDADRLRTELSVVYSRKEFRHIGGRVNLVQFIRFHNLVSTFSEVLKLLKIALTLPLTSQRERLFPTRKRSYSFLEKTEDGLAMLSIGKEMVQSILRFNERVMDKFARLKGRRMEFIFKKAGVKTEDTASWISESLSSEDSSHSELVHSADPLALEDDSSPGTSSTVDIASLPGTSSIGLDPFLMPSSSSTPTTPPPPPPSQRLEMPPPRLAPSRGASPALQSTSVTQSLPLPQQKTGGQKKTLEENVVSSDLGGNEFDDALLETNQLDVALQRLECISDKVDELGGRDDNFDNFGKYVASLLRGLPTQRAVDLQQEVVNLILRSHINPETTSVDTNSAPSSSENVVPSKLTPETVRTSAQPQPPSLPLSPLTPLTQRLEKSKQASSTVQSISVGKSVSVPPQSRKGEKRPLSDNASSSEVGNKQCKLDYPILDTEQIDTTLKKLEEISDKVNQLNEKDDNFDNFGKYAASLLRCLPTQRAVELQLEVVNLILREHGGSIGSTPQEVRLMYVITNTGVS